MKVSFSPPDMSQLEVNEVSEAIRSGWITTGPRTKEFENLIAMCCQNGKGGVFELGYSMYGTGTTIIGSRSGG